MRAGLLDTRITIVRPSPRSQDSFGGPIEDWAPFAAVWGQVTDQRGFRSSAAVLMQVQNVRLTLIVIRWVDGVNATMRVRFLGREMKIRSVSMRGRKNAIELLCEDINADE